MACVPTIFGEIPEKNVTFCIDTSGSMFQTLHVVRDHLLEILSTLAKRNQQTFNIIEFNSDISAWADKMILCTNETVSVARDWINKLEAKSGTNTLDALLTALDDIKCDAVYLVTDSLPDQHPSDVLDKVISKCENRPIHCIYITDVAPDSSVTNFLEELATETYGSLHILSLSTHGCTERITPVYRADHTHQRMLRTSNQSMYHPQKLCSMATTLQVDPEASLLDLIPAMNLMDPYHYPPPSYCHRWMQHNPYRCYYPHRWIRYHPARAWLKEPKASPGSFTDGLSPGAGSLLINKKILARRDDDGYYYIGTVHSQILYNKFLVVFGPCKHGKYLDTYYQETYVHDIIDYEEAKRHTILTGDKVLAPWEPDGERYGPGIVLEGYEDRQTRRESNDWKITVLFNNGMTMDVPLNISVWIPTPVYNRLNLELHLPQEVRKSLHFQTNYPQKSLPGYPTSGPRANPKDYDYIDPSSLEPGPFLVSNICNYPPCLPLHPVYLKHRGNQEFSKPQEKDERRMHSFLAQEMDISEKELQEKVKSQIHKYEDMLEQDCKGRLFSKRQKQEENSFKKSVTFIDSDEPEANNVPGRESFTHKNKDSPDLGFYEDFTDDDWVLKSTKNAGVNTDPILFQRKMKKFPDQQRPIWKYWRNDPIPSLSAGPKRYDPFRETALEAPIEAKDRSRNHCVVEWPSCSFIHVDTFAKGKQNLTVGDLLKMPKPPEMPASSSVNQAALVPPTVTAEPRHIVQEQKEKARQEYKRRVASERKQEIKEMIDRKEKAKDLQADQHRMQVLERLIRENRLQMDEQQQIDATRKAKQLINSEIHTRMANSQREANKREQKRFQAQVWKREQRELQQAEKKREAEEGQEQRVKMKAQRIQSRCQALRERLNQEEAQEMAKQKRVQNAKLKRIEHFQNLEQESQRKKESKIAASYQQLALYRSQVLP